MDRALEITGALNVNTILLKGALNINTITLEGDLTYGGEKLPYYTGAYEVTPAVIEQILPTARKSMSDDVTIKEIPHEEVSNESGGYTFIIGGV